MGLFADGDRGYPDHFADSGNHRSLWTFGSDGDLAGKIILFHNICAIVIWLISFLLFNVLRAASDVMYTMIIGVGSMWVFRILSGYLLGSVLGMGVFGVWVAMIIDWVVRSVCFLIRYHGGKMEASGCTVRLLQRIFAEEPRKPSIGNTGGNYALS